MPWNYHNDPRIVQFAAKGNLQEVNGGYEKEWTWNTDTPLIAAVRNGRMNVVKYLMDDHFPNPFHSSCLSEDVHDNVMSLIRKEGTASSIQMGEYIAEALYDEAQKGRIPPLFALVTKEIKKNSDIYSLDGLPEPVRKELDNKANWRFRPEGQPLTSFNLKPFFRELGKMFMDETKKKQYYNPQKAALWLSRSMANAPERATSLYDRAFDVDSFKALQRLQSEHSNEVGTILAESLPSLECKYETWVESMEELKKKEEVLRKEIERKNEMQNARRQKAEKKRAKKQARLDAEFSIIREAEVQRCSVVNGGYSKVTSGVCTGDWSRHDADYCTYYHPHHDLPPHCRWGTSCRYQESCRYNHLPRKTLLPYICSYEIICSSDEKSSDEDSRP